MSKPQDFSFKIVRDEEVGLYIQFYYLSNNYSEDVWDDLEEIISDEIPLLARLEESSYETDEGMLREMTHQLCSLGFTEIQ